MSGHCNFNGFLAKMSPENCMRVKVKADTIHREYLLSQIRQHIDARISL